MGYIAKDWVAEEIITQSNLDHIENGIQANSESIEILTEALPTLATKNELADYATKTDLTEYVRIEDLPEYDIDIDPLPKSIYEGKTLSILGDSMSTFGGYIPSSYPYHYPRENAAAEDVQIVSDTWWWKLMNALGMTLNINNSYSGSKVTNTFNTGYIIGDQETADETAGCKTRCMNLRLGSEDPDVIIIWMGINDFNTEVELGDYDGTTPLPPDSDPPADPPPNTKVFSEAYAVMLDKILALYPYSEVWVCTLSPCEKNGDIGFPEINGNGVALSQYNDVIRNLAKAFGVRVLDHHGAGVTYQNRRIFIKENYPGGTVDNLHLNKYGHSIIANNDIRQMDGSVRTRYNIKE